MMDEELLETARYTLQAFREQEARITTAESCTGGLIAAALTSIPGSSDVFDRGFVTYSNEAKHEMLAVPTELLEQFGAVSKEVALSMAKGALAASSATAAVAVTGIAGPGGGTVAKPVGLVFVAIAGPDGLFVEELRLGNKSRDEIRLETAQTALEMLVALGLSDE